MANKCNTCGATIPDNATTCPYCGNAVTPTQSYGAEVDEPSNGLNWLSLLVPIAGLVFFLVFKKDSPIKAKSCGKWALIGLAIEVGIEILFALLGE